MYAGMSIAAVIPARDEAGAIESVVRDLLEVSDGDGQRIIERVIVVDNASKDDTAERAAVAGAIVVREPDGAYGAACLRGIAAIGSADVVLFVDGDASCCAMQVPELLRAIADGADLAIGARIEALRERGAMTLPQRCGNTLAVSLIAWLWGVRFTDLGPFRAMRAQSLKALHMRDVRFGWTTEMQVKALLAGMGIAEVPVVVRRRIGRSKISGTVRGTLLAGWDIVGTILRLRWRQGRREPGGARIGRKEEAVSG